MNDPSRTSWLPQPRWLGLITFLILVGTALLPICIRLHNQQQTIKIIRDRGGSVDIEKGGPTWLRNLVGDKGMWPFDTVVAIVLLDETSAMRNNRRMKCIEIGST